MRLLLALSVGAAVGFGWHQTDDRYEPVAITVSDVTDMLGCSIWKYRVPTGGRRGTVEATVELLRRGQPPERLMKMEYSTHDSNPTVRIAIAALGHPHETQADTLRLLLFDTAYVKEIPNPFRGLVGMRSYPPSRGFEGDAVTLMAGWKRNDGDVIVGPDMTADPEVALRLRFGSAK